METVKKTAEYRIVKKRSGRYGVLDASGKWLNGDEKVKVLLAEKLIKAPAPKPAEPEPVAEEVPAAAAEEAAEEPKTEADA
jgi:hypothetical protein